MRKFLMALAVFCLAQSAFAASDNEKSDNKTQTKCESLAAAGATKQIMAQSGCCSHHGGVCGCTGGSVTCCDGAFSPSCGCSKEEPVHITN